MNAMTQLAVAMGLFVGLHFIMSHPMRAGLVKGLGERGFMGLYSVVSLATFIWAIMAYRDVPAEPRWWIAPEWLLGVSSGLLLLASILMAGSYIGNPALPAPGAAKAASGPARGVFAITRHPMMWAFALWSITHIAVAPSLANLVLAGGLLILAIGGSMGQDAKKARLMGAAWQGWRRRTSFVPFAKLISQGGWPHAFPGWGVLIGGVLLWLIASWAHGPLAGLFVGIWR